MSKKKKTTTKIAPPPVRHVVASRSGRGRVARGAGRAAKAVAAVVARVVGSKCPLCGLREGTTQAQFGSLSVKVCEQCSKPMWHFMGLMDWFNGGGKK